MRLLYTLLFYLLIPLLLARLWWRGRKAPGYRKNWTQRLGLGNRLSGPVIWIHAVSVGETLAVVPLVERLLKRYPSHRILMTNMTPTGAAQVEKAFGDRVEQRFCPWDLPLAWSAFLRRVKPAICIVVETELWPNLVSGCTRKGVPVMLVNARLSERSARGYRRFSALTRPMLQRLNLIAAQHEADAGRFRELGAPPERVSVTGSIKFDISPDLSLRESGRALRTLWGAERPVVIAASTHEGEDELLLRSWQALQERQPELMLVLVPRHPERFAGVTEVARRFSSNVCTRSSGEKPDSETAIYMGDTMGELMMLYAAADIAFVGGSFSGTGGHNPLEPAALGLPVVMGPDTFNFSAICEALKGAGGMSQVVDEKVLTAQLGAWLEQPDQARVAGRAGEAFLKQNQGALDRLEALIAERLDTRH
ncbi:lipid IV(A) 3-deoxy-D-manno-octulosonic acid transferase [Marinobacterium mangrovicola]|uniref:3-deoxy-D-manno-octulosonic acid transferase n=1 Tax=Marinobacterium mangrovicola TaxID=1476959 RepID=A0A4R1H7Q6_9GAMM|nr:lipid IV(A) 3-deoxy-D-manno-octulosonic acid transferase [Marinobacterium mangrovicola]TCK16501.1 3-deoxy-D-manno-octulosonic-acid transferase [Marinobacterium mangrovicola]